MEENKKVCCSKKGGCTPYMIAKILVIIGGINWGLVGLGILLNKGDSWNVVRAIFGTMSTFEAIIYVLVGISTIIMIFGCKCKKCGNVNKTETVTASQSM